MQASIDVCFLRESPQEVLEYLGIFLIPRSGSTSKVGKKACAVLVHENLSDIMNTTRQVGFQRLDCCQLWRLIAKFGRGPYS